jgi:ribosomal protein L29
MKTTTVLAKAKRIDKLVTTIGKLESELAALRTALVNQLEVSPGKAKVVKKRRKMSKESRAKIAAAQKARWAKLKK